MSRIGSIHPQGNISPKYQMEKNSQHTPHCPQKQLEHSSSASLRLRIVGSLDHEAQGQLGAFS